MFNKSLLSFFTGLVLLSVTCTYVQAKVVVNEVLNNPSGEESGAEWVELYNTENSPVTLNGCILYLDADTMSQQVAFSDSDFIDKFKVISWDSSWLNNSGDTVKIICGSDSDVVSYGDENGSVVDDPVEGISFGRKPDGIGSFVVLATVTLGEPNSNPPTSTPLPTNSPTQTPKPTSTQKPTVTDSPTSTPRPTNTLVPTTRTLPTGEITRPDGINSDANYETNALVAGIQTGSDTSDNNNVETETEMKPDKFPVAAILLMLVGTILLGISLLPIIRNYKKKI